MSRSSIRLQKSAPASAGSAAAVLLAALGFELVIAAIDVITGNRITTNFLLVAPLALAAYGAPREVLIAGAPALALVVLSGIWDHYFFTLDHLLRVGVVSSGFALALAGAGNRRRAETAVAQLHATREQLDLTLGAMAEAVTVHDDTGRLTFVNPAALKLLGLGSADEALAAEPGAVFARFEGRREDGSELSIDEMPGRRPLRSGSSEPLLARWLDRGSGQERWLLVKTSQYRDDHGRNLAVNVIEDVTETKESELRGRFLAHAGEVLSSSLDFEDTLQTVARLAVPPGSAPAERGPTRRAPPPTVCTASIGSARSCSGWR